MSVAVLKRRRRTAVAAGVTLTEAEDGSPVITSNGTTLEITISGSSVSAYNGTFGPFTIADLSSGPLSVVPPGISGTAGIGETLTRDYAGLWIYDSGNPEPVITAIWQSDDVDISGETGTTFDVTATEAETDVTYQETATQSGTGARSADSNAISIPAAPASLTSAVVAAGGANIVSVWDATDFANMFTDTGGTTPVTAVSDAVRRINDTVGSNDVAASSGNAVAQSGYIDWNDVAMDGLATFPELTTGMEFYALLDNAAESDTNYILIAQHNNASRYTGHTQSGGGGSPLGGFTGTPVFTVDNVPISNQSDRGEYYSDVVAAGGYCVQGIHTADFNYFNTGQIRLLGYSGGAPYSAALPVKALVLCTGMDTSTRAAVVSALQGYA